MKSELTGVVGEACGDGWEDIGGPYIWKSAADCHHHVFRCATNDVCYAYVSMGGLYLAFCVGCVVVLRELNAAVPDPYMVSFLFWIPLSPLNTLPG